MKRGEMDRKGLCNAFEENVKGNIENYLHFCVEKHETELYI